MNVPLRRAHSPLRQVKVIDLCYMLTRHWGNLLYSVGKSVVFLDQRTRLACLAISLRRAGLIDLARDGPPTKPPLRAATLRASGSVFSDSAACTTLNALTFTSTQPPQGRSRFRRNSGERSFLWPKYTLRVNPYPDDDRHTVLDDLIARQGAWDRSHALK